MGWWRVWGAECGCGERVVEGEKGQRRVKRRAQGCVVR